MTNNDLNQISSLMDQKLKDFGKSVDNKFKVFGTDVDEKFKDFGEDVDKKFKDLGKSVDQKFKSFGETFDQKLAASESRVIGEVGKFVEDHLIPLIDEKADKSDIDRLESKLDRVIDINIVHEGRLKDIEQVSVVAHELRLKKAK